MDDKKRGLYKKFIVMRTDGSSDKGGKHENCKYFVLDLTHDKYAKAALRTYAKACKKEFPNLALELEAYVAFGSKVL